MRAISCFGLVGVALLVCFAFTLQMLPQAIAAEPVPVAEEAKVFPIVYRVGDLPVWSKEGDYTPDLLMTLIQATISPDTWEAKGGPSALAPYPQDAAIIVRTTASNHDALALLIKRFRS